MSGYLFLCCAMYSSKRFRANKAATKQSCRSNMSITSFLSEGEKTCSLRSQEEATATGRQCLHPTKSVVCKRFLPCVCRNKAIYASLLGVSKVTDFSVALLLYTIGGGLSISIRKTPLRRKPALSAGAFLPARYCLNLKVPPLNSRMAR